MYHLRGNLRGNDNMLPMNIVLGHMSGRQMVLKTNAPQLNAPQSTAPKKNVPWTYAVQYLLLRQMFPRLMLPVQVLSRQMPLGKCSPEK